MSLNYIKPDEEFFGCMKLTSGEELLGRIVVVEEHKGFYCAFIQDPAQVLTFGLRHANALPGVW